MRGPDPAWLSLEAAAAAIARRELSAEELIRGCLERIARLEPSLHAFITVTGQEAASQARELDRELASGRTRGPLHGTPIALKDLLDTAAVRTTAGSKIFAQRVPREDAAVVSRLRSAGAISVGKTNLHEWALGVTTQNPHFGGTRNPWDLARIPGGSSGGSGAALAAGLCHGALGSDTGGSIRIPASLCGIVGLKPTYGRVSVRGAIPLSWNLDHVGPMARTVRDVALLYRVIAGYDRLDPASIEVVVDDPLPGIEDGVRGALLAVPREGFFERADADVAELVRSAIGVLEREGAVVEEVAFPGASDLLEVQRIVLATDAAAFHSERIRDRAADFGEDVLARLRTGTAVSGTDYAAARRRRDEIRSEVARLLERYDAVVTPTTAVAAPPAASADAREMSSERGGAQPAAVAAAARLTALTSPFNLTGLPAISVPCGFTAEGLPVGLQIASGHWREATVLRVARAYERATSWSDRRPTLAA